MRTVIVEAPGRGRAAFLGLDDRCSVSGRTRKFSADFFLSSSFTSCVPRPWHHLENNCVAEVSEEQSASLFRVEVSAVGNKSCYTCKEFI
jgi:hypothetical protein